MSQGEQDCVEALVTVSHLDRDGAPDWETACPR